MKVTVVQNNETSPLQNVYVSINDIEEIITNVINYWGIIQKDVYEPKQMYLMNIVEKEKEYSTFMSNFNLLQKIGNKFNKQVENIYSPIMKVLNKKELYFSIQEIGDFVFTQDINVVRKFDYATTNDFLMTKVYNITIPEQRFAYEKYLEETAWFWISMSWLSDLLKEKGYLEEQIDKWMENYIYRETTVKNSLVLPVIYKFDPSLRSNFIFTDIAYVWNNWLIQSDPIFILSLAHRINETLKSYKWFSEKIKKIMEEDDDVKSMRFQYLWLIKKERNSNKISWLFQDNQWNKIDVIDDLVNIFQLTDQDVNQFVNSRKRNTILLPDKETDIFLYDREDIKFTMETHYEWYLADNK